MRKRSIHVKGETPDEFVKAYEKAYADNECCENFREKFVTDTSMYLFFDDPRPEVTDELIEDIRQQAEDSFSADYEIDVEDHDEIEETRTIRIELTIGVPKKRYCCECENYAWGKGCPFCGHVKGMAPACELFNVYFGRVGRGCRK